MYRKARYWSACKKACFEFFISICGAAVAAAAFVKLWPDIDYFFYTKLQIVLECDGCHTLILVLLFLCVPAGAALGIYLLNRICYKARSVSGAVTACLCTSLLGGSMSLLLLQFLSGSAAALAILLAVGSANTAGYHVPQWIKAGAKK